MAQLLRTLAIVALYALLLPVFGPLLDHHFVEWQHNHGHIYLDGRTGGGPGHTHVYELAGSHTHIPGPASPAGGLPFQDVAYLNAYEGAGAGLIYAPTGPSLTSLCFPESGNCPPLLGYAAAERIPSGRAVAPPRQPPRT